MNLEWMKTLLSKLTGVFGHNKKPSKTDMERILELDRQQKMLKHRMKMVSKKEPLKPEMTNNSVMMVWNERIKNLQAEKEQIYRRMV